MDRRILPPRYLRGFAAEGPPAGPSIWVYRPQIGEWRRVSIEAEPCAERHFNVPRTAGTPDGGLERELLDGEAPGLAHLVRAAQERVSPSPEERGVAARFLAVLGVSRAPGAEGLAAAEAEAGVASLERALSEMGWVFWRAEAPAYFITSSAPLRVAYPKAEEGWLEGMDVRSPGTEITLPLTPRLALHASWKLGGERWRPASEDVLMEVNGRTAQRAREFLAAPWPAVPG
ncbi:DUF4238 domain-containing protein [Anaeromyxobacter terrae]|uniref:DUF4238 domain-containing protein n=1 Tax=Anaeromyxobacter terrae TaxID=2925406 RepID=UPI001F55E85E|nr:DUF4238 domain-containing protein [Anaeromyxobacter sp. SG22]